MPVLHIEHQIANLGTWLRDFASRAPARKQVGITEVHVRQMGPGQMGPGQSPKTTAPSTPRP